MKEIGYDPNDNPVACFSATRIVVSGPRHTLRGINTRSKRGASLEQCGTAGSARREAGSAVFTFGIPRPDAMAKLKARHIDIIGTATTVEEARLLSDAGVDAILAQGAEAGAHRGTFAGPFESAMIPTFTPR